MEAPAFTLLLTFIAILLSLEFGLRFCPHLIVDAQLSGLHIALYLHGLFSFPFEIQDFLSVLTLQSVAIT